MTAKAFNAQQGLQQAQSCPTQRAGEVIRNNLPELQSLMITVSNMRADAPELADRLMKTMERIDKMLNDAIACLSREEAVVAGELK